MSEFLKKVKKMREETLPDLAKTVERIKEGLTDRSEVKIDDSEIVGPIQEGTQLVKRYEATMKEAHQVLNKWNAMLERSVHAERGNQQDLFRRVQDEAKIFWRNLKNDVTTYLEEEKEIGLRVILAKGKDEMKSLQSYNRTVNHNIVRIDRAYAANWSQVKKLIDRGACDQTRPGCTDDVHSEENTALLGLKADWKEMKLNLMEVRSNLEDVQAQVNSGADEKNWKELEDQITQILNRMDSLDADAAETLTKIKSDYTNLEGFTKKEGECGYKITDPPCVIIYDRIPPSVNLEELRTCKAIQDFVAREFSAFEWRYNDIDEKAGGKCDVFEPTPSQLLGYHYMHPYNPHMNGMMLCHSAGSGKTAAGMLIYSVFARAGYRGIIVGTKSLKQDNPYIFEAAFQQNMDFNVQQYIYSMGVSSMLEAYNIENPGQPISSNLLKNETKKGINARKALMDWGSKKYNNNMGIKFRQTSSVMSYAQQANLAKAGLGYLWDRLTQAQQNRINYGNKTIREWLWGEERDFDPEDPFENIMFLVDESHKLIDMRTSAQERGNLMAMTLGCWNSYRYAKLHPGHKAVKVLLMTATPQKYHPIDLINQLNLLTTPEEDAILLLSEREYEEYALLDSKEFSAKLMTEIVPKMIRNFNRLFAWNSTTGRFTNQEILERLLRGRVSYLNMMGDINHIATPRIVYMDVVLTQAQEDSIKKCFTTNARLEYNPRTGDWKQQPRTPTKQKTRSTRSIDDEIDAMFEDDDDSLFEKVSKEGDLSLADYERLQKCVSESLVWPNNNRDAKNVMKTSNPRRLNREVRKYSALLGQLFTNLEKLRRNSIPRFRSEGMPAAIHQIKQAVFVASKGSNEVYTAAELFVKTHNYTIINKDKSANPRLAEGKPYKNVIVLHKRLDQTGQKRLLELFNSPANIGGRLATIIFYNSDFQEGITLKGVGAVHVCGLVHSRADLLQGVARGIRNCSHVGFPYPWYVNVYIYYSYLSTEGSMRKAQLTPQDVLSSLSGVSEPLQIQAMSELMQRCAFDRLLNQAVNDRSRDTESKFQLRSSRDVTLAP